MSELLFRASDGFSQFDVWRFVLPPKNFEGIHLVKLVRDLTRPICPQKVAFWKEILVFQWIPSWWNIIPFGHISSFCFSKRRASKVLHFKRSDGFAVLLEKKIFWKIRLVKYHLGGGFKHLLFSPLPGEDSHFD